jgi:hypothetical protein
MGNGAAPRYLKATGSRRLLSVTELSVPEVDVVLMGSWLK